nr:polysaccharide pyruvyl transferase family protein [uncultured Albidiferax sp.]
MKVFAVDGVKGNFGDELNNWMWNRLAPELFTKDDDSLLVGIGTILDEKLPAAQKKIVFGSGAGYGRLPTNTSLEAGWAIYGVRGKLTAKVLNLPPSAAATDPAILLATLDDLRAPKNGGTIFIPHWKTTRFGRWADVCKASNIKLVDPCQESPVVIREISGASKVIAESMHAAIIADCFRVPWVPVVLSREVSAFKWRDWGSSLNVPYEPRCIPASSPVEGLRDKLLEKISAASIKNYPSLEKQRSGAVLDFSNEKDLIQDFLNNVGQASAAQQGHVQKIAEILIKRISTIEKKFYPASAAKNEKWYSEACKAMEYSKRESGYLSSDSAHHFALEDITNRLDKLKHDFSSGTIFTKK